MFFVLPLERVADSTHPVREDLGLAAAAVHHVLFELRHRINRSRFSKTTTSTSQL